MEEWKEYKLGDICEVLNGRAYKQEELLEEGKYPVLRVGNIFQGNNWYYSDLELPDDKYCYSGDLLYAWSCGFAPYIWDGGKTIYHYHIWKLVENDKIVDKTFLYYYLIINTKRFLGGTHGSVMMHLTKKDMESQIIQLPSINTQKKIAEILKSLDDKIEVNRRINENLEQQAQALFKSWFVDFEPFKDQPFVESELGMIPQGWRIGLIGDYCRVRSGFAFKSSWWKNEGVPVIKIKNITDNGRLEMNECSFVSKEHASLAKDFHVNSGDLLIAMTGATIGKFCIVPTNSDYCVNQRVGRFFLGSEPIMKLPFIYYTLKMPNVLNEIVNKGQGSAQPNISSNDIESVNIVLPPENIISKFNLLLNSSMYNYIKNEQESRRLAELRDALLPRLMSGELKVNDLENNEI